MSVPDPPETTAAEPGRRERAAELLGELLPEISHGESDRGWGEHDDHSRDNELRRDVPPHHGPG